MELLQLADDVFMKGPSGLTGKPDNVDNFEELLVEDVKIYVKRDFFLTHLIENPLTIALEGYGRFILEICNENQIILKKGESEMSLDRRMYELIAIGSSIAANCKP